jgi:hypothetical protein
MRYSAQVIADVTVLNKWLAQIPKGGTKNEPRNFGSLYGTSCTETKEEERRNLQQEWDKNGHAINEFFMTTARPPYSSY